MTKQEIRKEEEHSSLLRLSSLSGLKKNKIIDSYLEILLLTFRLSKVSSIETSTINNLKEDLVNDILALNAKLNALKQYDEKDILRSQYCLSVFIDESLMRNELFINSAWASDTLTVRLFDETLGGTNFYDIAAFWLNNPAKYKDFLEFIYVCLILGYQGKYIERKDVKERIIHLCNNIAAAITPLLNGDEETAFMKAYKISNQETWWERFLRLHLKKVLIILPIVIIVAVFLYALLELETNNAKMQKNINGTIENFISQDE